jgi:serine/threonine protein kinase
LQRTRLSDCVCGAAGIVSELMSRGTLFRYLSAEGKRRAALAKGAPSNALPPPLSGVSSAAVVRVRMGSGDGSASAAAGALAASSNSPAMKLQTLQSSSAASAAALAASGHPPLTFALMLQWCIQTCRALVYLHSGQAVPVVHRDIKSLNLLLDHNWNIKLADLGEVCLLPVCFLLSTLTAEPLILDLARRRVSSIPPATIRPKAAAHRIGCRPNCSVANSSQKSSIFIRSEW